MHGSGIKDDAVVFGKPEPEEEAKDEAHDDDPAPLPEVPGVPRKSYAMERRSTQGR